MSVAQPLVSPVQQHALEERDRVQSGVTVCITVHNEDRETIWGAIDSVVEQTVPAVELIVVDDGSDTPFMLDGWTGRVQPQETLLRVVHLTNRGLPAARNTAIMLTRTAGFIPLDADDRLDPRYIELTLPLLADHDVVLTGLQEVGPHRNGRYNAGFDRPFDQVTWELLAHDYNRFFYCSLFRTQTLRDVGGYHPAMAGWPGVHGGFEDWDLWIDLLRRGVRFAAVDEPLLLYNTATPGSMLQRAESNRAALVNEMHRHHRLGEHESTR